MEKVIKILVAELSFSWAFLSSRVGGFIGKFFGFVFGPFVSYLLKGFGEGLESHNVAKEFIYYRMKIRAIKKESGDNKATTNNKDNSKNAKSESKEDRDGE